MIVHRHRGEVKAILDGKPFVLCLTLGALAELEERFAADDIQALSERFSSGQFSVADMVRIVGAGLRGAGHVVDDRDILSMQIEGSIEGWKRLVDELLDVTFGVNQ